MLKPTRRSHFSLRADLEDRTTTEKVVEGTGNIHTVEVDTRTEPLAEGDLFLLTSDGLHASLGEAQMASLVWAHPDLRAAVNALLDAAPRTKARDNLTALLVKV